MKKQDTPISAGSAAALSARITATLGPLDADELVCAEKLEDLAAQVASLQDQIHDAEENLRIIKGAKVDAIRALMSDDPLLAQAFGAAGGGPSGNGGTSSVQEAAEEAVEAAVMEDEEVVDAVAEAEDAEGSEGADGEDGNPLLKMDE